MIVRKTNPGEQLTVYGSKWNTEVSNEKIVLKFTQPDQ